MAKGGKVTNAGVVRKVKDYQAAVAPLSKEDTDSYPQAVAVKGGGRPSGSSKGKVQVATGRLKNALEFGSSTKKVALGAGTAPDEVEDEEQPPPEKTEAELDEERRERIINSHVHSKSIRDTLARMQLDQRLRGRESY